MTAREGDAVNDKCLDLQDWKAFVQIDESGGVRNAAAALGVEPSTISRRIASLESRLGVRLFRQTGRSLLLTPEGEIALRRMKPVIHAAELSVEAIRSRTDAPERNLHVIAPVGYTHEMVRRASADFLRAYPKTRLWLESWQYGSERFEELGEGIDTIISTILRQNPKFEIPEISHHRDIVCASPGYLAVNRPIRRPEDLPGQMLAGISMFISDLSFHHRATGETVRPDLDYRILSDNSHAMAEWSAAGNGILIGCPFTVAAPFVTEKRLVQVLPDWEIPSNHVWAYAAKSQYADPDSLVYAFFAALKTTSDTVAEAAARAIGTRA